MSIPVEVERRRGNGHDTSEQGAACSACVEQIRAALEAGGFACSNAGAPPPPTVTVGKLLADVWVRVAAAVIAAALIGTWVTMIALFSRVPAPGEIKALTASIQTLTTRADVRDERLSQMQREQNVLRTDFDATHPRIQANPRP